jgi:AraC-like DNA-binding protein
MFDVASYQFRGMLAAFRELGLDTDALARQAGVDPVRLLDPDARFPEQTLLALWTQAESRWNRPLLGLQAGVSVPFGAFDMLDYLAGSSATVGDVFVQLQRYARLCTSGLSYDITPDHEGFIVAMQHPYLFEVAPLGLREYMWTVLVGRLRAHLGDAFRSVLRLRHAPCGPVKEYRRLLGEVSFEQAHDELRISHVDWRRPNPRADLPLITVLERYAQRVVSSFPKRDDDIVGLVRQAVVGMLRHGEPGIAEVAQLLALTPRTMQRRLAERGYSYKSLLSELRAELAQTYLTEATLSLSDIAFLLGYSETSPFIRAFRRRTGQTPGQFREQSVTNAGVPTAQVSAAADARARAH